MTFTFRRDRALGVVGILALLLAALLLLASCGTAGESDDQAGTTEAAENATRTVETDKGDVEVPADPQRVVVLSGGLAGYAFALDVPVAATDTRVLGVTDLKGDFPPAWADAATAQGTTPLPGGEQMSIEAVAAAEPDLIIGGGQGITAVQADERYDELTAIAPTVLIPRTATGWQDQLELFADAVNKQDEAAELISGYETRRDEVAEMITAPEGEVAVVLSLPQGGPWVVPAKAALPALLGELGLTPEDTHANAGSPELFGSGDSMEIAPEMLPEVVQAMTVVVVPMGGKTLAEMEADPVYQRLVAFRDGEVVEFPATTYRPDYDGAMDALDAAEQAWG